MRAVERVAWRLAMYTALGYFLEGYVLTLRRAVEDDPRPLAGARLITSGDLRDSDGPDEPPA